MDLVGISLSDIARTAFEDLMATGNYEFQSDFAKKHRAAGEAAGEAVGEAKGEAKGEARGVIKFLEARHISVTDEQKERILGCTDLEVLDRWIRKAVSVVSAEELFID